MSVARSELKFRAPPSMRLSDGSTNSKTSRPEHNHTITTSLDRAQDRFAVTGNAIVTGGAGDIGSVACRALLEHGLQGLAIFDLHPDSGQKAVTSLQSDFPEAKITFTKVDVTDSKSVTAAVANAEQVIGPVNICLCFAGIAFAAHALDITPQQFKTMFDVNTTGAFLVAQAVAKSIASRGIGGSIILMASISAHIVNFPQPQVHYNAAKAAIISMKSSLAAEWAVHGIRVNSISPGYMDTILNEGDGLAEHRAIWAKRTPYGRMGNPEELTGAVVLLASKAGTYITGADILVDGGISVF
ncbi:Short-chain dehydrogenase/reductase SDR [Fusarium oxysporum f. sp. vasinfectum]|uniref:D-arabinitol 2-dehydrogenase [ribulose-forming] n=1 Tax=Fusarium oxysporum f. sp. vasinfectum 25433 TaxID=1089449 RepID=X0MFC5_FUSOX|nr:gluconate 5-dehydrogenase [Fusarium oxysporum f. sp. vasinfectum 25433]KAK2674542.1 Short-chain dehydrogenase/reductase SDR [Fusarium oxysporum f. sp. vasinfectum]KAK2930974.1 Short-chain dehydrogenase/reductase SDR [Fusarium oxysporum f. sp. vasinfectum]